MPTVRPHCSGVQKQRTLSDLRKESLNRLGLLPTFERKQNCPLLRELREKTPPFHMVMPNQAIKNAGNCQTFRHPNKSKPSSGCVTSQSGHSDVSFASPQHLGTTGRAEEAGCEKTRRGRPTASRSGGTTACVPEASTSGGSKPDAHSTTSVGQRRLGAENSVASGGPTAPNACQPSQRKNRRRPLGIHPSSHNSTSVRVLQWNLNSLNNKKNELLNAINAHNLTILALQETLCRFPVDLPGFTSFHVLKTDGRRGLATYVDRDIPAEQLPVNLHSTMEILIIKIYINPRPLYVINLYSGLDRFDLATFSHLAERFSNFDTIFLGDFNAHSPAWGDLRINRAGSHLSNWLAENDSFIVLNEGEPTHIQGGVLDLAIATIRTANNANWSVAPDVCSDHYGILITFNNINTGSVIMPRSRWNAGKADWHKFKNLLNDLNLNYPNENISLEELDEEIIFEITNAANKAIPKINTTFRAYKPAAVSTPKITELKKLYNQALKEHKKFYTENTRATLREIQVAYRKECLSEKQKQFSEWLESLNHLTSSKLLWQKLNKMRKKFSPPPLIANPQEKADCLVREFAVRSADASYPDYIKNSINSNWEDRLEKIMGKINTQANSDTPFTLTELLIALKKKDTAPGPDSITYSMLYNIPERYLYKILLLFNTSLRLGSLPTRWKLSEIIPIPKKDTTTFRPISLCSVLCKIMEKMVLNRLKYIIGPSAKNMFGYLPGVGAEDAVACLTSKIEHSFRYKNGKCIVVFVDITKAFERANKLIIMEKLVERGVRGRLLKWLFDFLSDRKSRVTIQGHESDFVTFDNGTPQGSIISPTLFNLIINDLISIDVPAGTSILAYADDVAICVEHCKNLVSTTQRVLNKFSEKCISLGLEISVDKTQGVLFSKGRQTHPSLTLMDRPLTWDSSFKYLGIWLDAKLTFRKHITYTVDRVRQRLNILKILTATKIGANYHILRSFYLATIRSILEYGSQSFFKIKALQIQSLEKVQNTALRIIFGAPPWTNTNTMCREAELLPLSERRTFSLINTIFKYARHYQKIDLYDKLTTQPNSWRENAFFRHIKNTLSIYNLEIPDYSPDPAPFDLEPWRLPQLKLYFAPVSKKLSTPTAGECLNFINSLTKADTEIIYTDGSCDPLTGASGSAFYWKNKMSLLSKLSDGCSSTQAEIMAITQALEQVFQNSETKSVAIVTDSQSAMQAIANFYPSTNKLIIRYAHEALIQLNNRKTQVIFIWVPSHVGIPGNEKVDSLAALAKNCIDPPVSPTPFFVEDIIEIIPKSATQIRSKIFNAVKLLHENHLKQQSAGSDSLDWHINYCRQPLKLPRDVGRRSQRLLHKIRLGYKDFIDFTLKPFPPCQLCNRFYHNKFLIHYLIDCENTDLLRHHLRNELQLPNVVCDLPQVMGWLGNTKLLPIVLNHITAFPPMPLSATS